MSQFYKGHDPKHRCNCPQCEKLAMKRGIFNLAHCKDCGHHHYHKEKCKCKDENHSHNH